MCGTVVCSNWCVVQLCVVTGVWYSCVQRLVCGTVVCSDWCVIQLCAVTGVWYSCVQRLVCGTAVCSDWCVVQLFAATGVWYSCVQRLLMKVRVLTFMLGLQFIINLQQKSLERFVMSTDVVNEFQLNNWLFNEIKIK